MSHCKSFGGDNLCRLAAVKESKEQTRASELSDVLVAYDSVLGKTRKDKTRRSSTIC